jgi:hypothetical protein
MERKVYIDVVDRLKPSLSKFAYTTGFNFPDSPYSKSLQRDSLKSGSFEHLPNESLRKGIVSVDQMVEKCGGRTSALSFFKAASHSPKGNIIYGSASRYVQEKKLILLPSSVEGLPPFQIKQKNVWINEPRSRRSPRFTSRRVDNEELVVNGPNSSLENKIEMEINGYDGKKVSYNDKSGKTEHLNTQNNDDEVWNMLFFGGRKSPHVEPVKKTLHGGVASPRKSGLSPEHRHDGMKTPTVAYLRPIRYIFFFSFLNTFFLLIFSYHSKREA